MAIIIPSIVGAMTSSLVPLHSSFDGFNNVKHYSQLTKMKENFKLTVCIAQCAKAHCLDEKILFYFISGNVCLCALMIVLLK